MLRNMRIQFSYNTYGEKILKKSFQEACKNDTNWAGTLTPPSIHQGNSIVWLPCTSHSQQYCRPGNNSFIPFGHMADSMPFSIGHSYFLSDIKVKKCRVCLLIVTKKV